MLLCFSDIYQNGSLLQKYTYLSNDSSYSVSFEDGVDIVLLDSSSSGDAVKSVENRDESSDATKVWSSSESDPNRLPSFTFETQVK